MDRKLVQLLVIFLIINFGGLYLGSALMNNGPVSNWYLSLAKAPWTPPGWVFGVAWTTIMICFSIYLAYLFKFHDSLFLRFFFALQVFLNVSWNYFFFNRYLVFFGLVIIISLLIVILNFYFNFKVKQWPKAKYFLLPYIAWLSIAISLNMYIVIHN